MRQLVGPGSTQIYGGAPVPHPQDHHRAIITLFCPQCTTLLKPMTSFLDVTTHLNHYIFPRGLLKDKQQNGLCDIYIVIRTAQVFQIIKMATWSNQGHRLKRFAISGDPREEL